MSRRRACPQEEELPRRRSQRRTSETQEAVGTGARSPRGAMEAHGLLGFRHVRVNHAPTLHFKLTFFLTDAVVLFELVLSTLCVPLLPARTLLEVFQDFVIEGALGNGA